MKALRNVFTFLFCLSLCICLGAAAHAAGTVVDSGTCGDYSEEITWTLYDTGELVIEGTGYLVFDYGTVWPKSEVRSVKIKEGVTLIGFSAFSDCTNLTSVQLPNGLLYIGDSAFRGCSSLENVTIPKGVTFIGNSAFRDCTGLTSVTIPEGVTSISSWTFDGCTSLESVTIQEGVTSIGSFAFDGCTGLTSVTIPTSVRSIGDYAFSSCSDLHEVRITVLDAWCGVEFGYSCFRDSRFQLYENGTLVSKLVIPKGVTSIEYGPFTNCVSLTSVTIPTSVTSIGDKAFEGCAGLTNITIPASVTNIGKSAFSYCVGLTSMTIPASVTSIGDFAFYSCYGLESVTIQKGVTSIGNSAFSYCCGLVSITIPESVTSIGEFAFNHCDNLLEVTIPKGVTSIGDYSFNECYNLASVTIPEGVTSIGVRAFGTCGLTSIRIPESVTSISDRAFEACAYLTSVTLPRGVTSIGGYTFCYCRNLTSITIPVGVTSIGAYAFSYCPALTDVFYDGSEEQWNAISVETEGNYALNNATIHLSTGTKVYTVSYIANGGVNAPASQIKTSNKALTLSDVIPVRETSSVGAYTVTLNNDGLPLISPLRAARTVTYSFLSWNTAADGSGTSYAPGASYTANEDVTLYGQWKSSTETAAVILPALTREGAVFRGWAADREAESGVTGAYTPSGNVTLYAIWLEADFVLPSSLASIGSEAFSGGAFTCVLIPETVTRIDSRAFAGCPRLLYAVFAGNETEIDPSAFEGVSGLTVVAPAGSTAETCAHAHGFAFLPAA